MQHKQGKYGWLIILLVVIGLIIWGASKILPYIPGVPQYVRLKSATYLRSPHVYRYSSSGYNPAQAPLAPEWASLVIDRENHQAVLQSSEGDQISIELGEPRWVSGCENQFLVESFALGEYLDLGSITVHNPVLITACDMWAAGEKVRPTRLVIMQGPIPEDDPFFLGMECNPGKEVCASFAQSLNQLFITVIDKNTRQYLPDATITISSGLGIQEYKGSVWIPVYAAMQLEYRINLPGYVDKNGVISNFYGTKLDIMYWTNADHTRGEGNDINLPQNGQAVEYSIELAKQ